MNHTEKTTAEWVVMRNFRRNWPFFPKGKLVKSESPDFVLAVSPRQKIGIELTSLHFETEPIIPSSATGKSIFLNSLIEKAISKKEEKLQRYFKSKANQYWLIFLVDFDLSIAEVLRNAGANAESRFQKIFIFQPAKEFLIELK